jgi:hypothetical protein
VSREQIENLLLGATALGVIGLAAYAERQPPMIGARNKRQTWPPRVTPVHHDKRSDGTLEVYAGPGHTWITPIVKAPQGYLTTIYHRPWLDQLVVVYYPKDGRLDLKVMAYRMPDLPESPKRHPQRPMAMFRFGLDVDEGDLVRYVPSNVLSRRAAYEWWPYLDPHFNLGSPAPNVQRKQRSS